MPPVFFLGARPLFQDVPTSFWFAFAFYSSICLLALWKGGREERLAGGVLCVAAFASSLLKDHNWLGIQWGLVAADLPVLAVMFWIAMRSGRWWPLFAAAFQFLAILTHTASLIDDSLGEWAYITAGVIWSYGMLFSVLTGTINAWRERRRAVAA